MAKTRFKHVTIQPNKNGNLRLRFRHTKARMKVWMGSPDSLGTPEFLEHLAILEATARAILEGRHGDGGESRLLPAAPVVDDKPQPNTFKWAVRRFQKSDYWQHGIKKGTRNTYAPLFKWACRQPYSSKEADGKVYADFPLDQLTTKALQILVNRKKEADSPYAANQLCKALRAFTRWGVKSPENDGGGFLQEDIGLALVKVDATVALSIHKRKLGLGEHQQHRQHTATHEEIESWRLCPDLPATAHYVLEAGLCGMAIADIGRSCPDWKKTDTDGKARWDYIRAKSKPGFPLRALPYVTPECEAAIRKLPTPIKPETPYLKNASELPRYFRKWRNIVNKWCARVGRPPLSPRFAPHSLRRRFACNYLERAAAAGMSFENAIFGLKIAGGWKSDSELQRYIAGLDLEIIAWGFERRMSR